MKSPGLARSVGFCLLRELILLQKRVSSPRKLRKIKFYRNAPLFITPPFYYSRFQIVPDLDFLFLIHYFYYISRHSVYLNTQQILCIQKTITSCNLERSNFQLEVILFYNNSIYYKKNKMTSRGNPFPPHRDKSCNNIIFSPMAH